VEFKDENEEIRANPTMLGTCAAKVISDESSKN
jgi:hypothetical protein